MQVVTDILILTLTWICRCIFCSIKNKYSDFMLIEYDIFEIIKIIGVNFYSWMRALFPSKCHWEIREMEEF